LQLLTGFLFTTNRGDRTAIEHGSSGIPGGYVLTTSLGVESVSVDFFPRPHAFTLPQDCEVTDGGQHPELDRRP
jgi:hypothetical protein